MQQPATYPIYYQTMLTPSNSATSTPINSNFPYQSSSYISYVQPQSFIRTNNFQFNSQNSIQSFSNNNRINSSISSISSNDFINNVNSNVTSRSASTSSNTNEGINHTNINNNNNNNNNSYQLPQPIHPQTHPAPIQIPLNMSMKYAYQQQPQPQFNQNIGCYQPLSPPISIRYSNSIIYNNNTNNINNEQQFPLTPSTDNKFDNSELSCNSSFNSSFNNNNNNNSNISEDIPQTNDISVLTPIPGCMAYHHPLIPIIPSASGNTRKQASKLLDNSLNNGNNTNTNTNNKNNNTMGNINGRLIENNNDNKENPEKIEVRRMAFGSPTWTSKDDELLRHLKETEKIGWRDISMYFPTRTINACQFRWRRLIMKEENRKKREAHKLAIKEKMLKNSTTKKTK